MVEHRTTPASGPSASDNDDDETSYSLDDMVNQAVRNLKGNPDAQQVVAGALQDNGVDPRYLAIFSEDMAKMMAQAQQQAQEKQNDEGGKKIPSPDKSDSEKQEEIDQMTQESDDMTQEVAKAKEITTEDILGFVEDLTAVLPQGEDTTLGELYELAEDNPDVVQNAIDTRLN